MSSFRLHCPEVLVVYDPEKEVPLEAVPVKLIVSPSFPVIEILMLLPLTEPLMVPTDEHVVPIKTWLEVRAVPF